MISNREIIITGATGFVGKKLISNIVKIYPAAEILCLVWDKNTKSEKEGRHIIKKAHIAYKKVDLVTKKGLNLNLKPKLVIHLAAQTDTAKSDHKVNNIGIRNFYEALGPLHKNTHFIHISTMVISSGRRKCEKPINEDTPDYPSNIYTRTKLEGEKYISKQCKKDNFRLTVIRPNTIYGRGARKDSLFDMLQNMISKNSIITRLNWPGKSALIHVDDFVNVILKVSSFSPLPGNPKKYLMYAENLTIEDISKIIHKLRKIEYKQVKIPKNLWNLMKIARPLIFQLEFLLPPKIYNWLWRGTIIVDNSVYAKTSKLSSKLKNWKPKMLAEVANTFIN